MERLDLATPHQYGCGSCDVPDEKSLILEIFHIVAIYYLRTSLVKNYIRDIMACTHDDNSGRSHFHFKLLQEEIA